MSSLLYKNRSKLESLSRHEALSSDKERNMWRFQKARKRIERARSLGRIEEIIKIYIREYLLTCQESDRYLEINGLERWT